jgi:hypothetical protein
MSDMEIYRQLKIHCAIPTATNCHLSSARVSTALNSLTFTVHVRSIAELSTSWRH